MHTLRFFIIIAAVFSSFTGLLSGCQTLSNEPQLASLQHEMVDKIWDTRQRVFINKTDVLERLSNTQYLLLGEKHDNPLHHQHQAWFIRHLKLQQAQASVAFEMIDNQQAKRLAERSYNTAEEMIAILNELSTNWQYEDHYHDLFTETITAGYAIDAANLNRKQLMQIIMQPEDKLPDAYQRMLDKTQLSQSALSSLQQEIIDSHCQMLDETTAQKFILAQQLRDAIMAHSLSTSQAAVKVLIAGAGHVRNDRGVPAYLGENSKILSVGFIEVEDNHNETDSYAKQWKSVDFPFDLVWFTPRVVREDPCQSIFQHFNKKSNKKADIE